MSSVRQPKSVDDLPPVDDAAAEMLLIGKRIQAVRGWLGACITLIVVGQFKPVSQYFFAAFPWTTLTLGTGGCVAAGHWVFRRRDRMTKSDEKKWAYFFGVVFVAILLLIAIFIPNPTAFQYTVFRIVLAVAVAGVAAMIPGFLTVKIAAWLRAGGALAIFVIVFFYSPAALVTS